MSRYKLQLDKATYAKIKNHLVSASEHALEEAAFLFCTMERYHDEVCFVPKDISLLPPAAFAHRSEHYLELTDDTRASIIKRAHDLEACLIELHSHPLQSRAEFSWSDLRGFEEFVPHVRWRLKGNPYVAMVLALQSFDSLVWDHEKQPSGTCIVEIGGDDHEPTGITYSSFEVLQ